MDYKKVFRDTGILIGATIISKGFVFLFRILCARYLPVDDYANLSIFISFFVMIIPLGFFNVAIPLSKYIAEYGGKRPDMVKKFYVNALLLLTITSVLTTVVLLSCAGHYGIKSWSVFLFIILGTFGYTVSRHNFGVFRGLKAIYSNAVVILLSGITQFGCLILSIFFFGGIDFNICIIVFFLGNIIPTIISLPLSYRLVGLSRSDLRADTAVISKIVHYSKYIVAANVMLMSLDFFSRFALSFVNDESVALFDITMLVYTSMSLILSNLVVILVPYVSEHASLGNIVKEPSGKIFIYSLSIAALISGCVLICNPILKTLAVAILDKEIYSRVPALYSIVMISLPFHIFFSIYSGFSQGSNRPDILMKATFVTVSLSIPFLMIMARVFGVYGVISGVCFSYVVRFLAIKFFYRRHLPAA